MKLIHKAGYGIFKRADSLYFSTGNQFFEFVDKQVVQITKKAYLSQKYGKENKYWNQPFDEFVRLKNGDFITTFYQKNEVLLHRSDGKIKRKFEKISSPFGMGIYGMTIDKNEKVWIAVPVEHYVGKFDIEKEEELFSIDGKDCEPTIFDHPECVTAIGDFVYISDMGNKRIVRINIDNHEIENYKNLNEPIYYFNQLNGKNIYVLKSGLYIESIEQERNE